VEALRVEELSKNFDGVLAVNNISFSVQRGEKVAVIGPNGSGKTTLFNLLNGQERGTRGRIFFFGKEIGRMSVYHRALLGQARSFQLTSLFPSLTVLVNVLLAVQGTKRSRYQPFCPISSYKEHIRKARVLLQKMGLWEKSRHLVQSLAYGEQRKLEIALSLASEPKLLLLDEPNCGLTPAESANMTNMIRQLGKDITILLVAHDMDLVFDLADRIIVLHYGQLIADGTPEKIQANPRVKEIYMGVEEGSEYARSG